MVEISDYVCDKVRKSVTVFFGDVRRFVMVTPENVTPSPVIAKMKNRQEYIDAAKQKYCECKAAKFN